MIVEKDWITKAGLRAAVVLTNMGHRCGYVAVPVGHPLHGVDYSEPCTALTPLSRDEPIGKRGKVALLLAADDESQWASPEIALNVHGSLTYSSKQAGGKYPVESDDLWWFGYDCAHYGDSPDVQTLDYCINECESLAKQLIERVKFDNKGEVR